MFYECEIEIMYLTLKMIVCIMSYFVMTIVNRGVFKSDNEYKITMW